MSPLDIHSNAPRQKGAVVHHKTRKPCGLVCSPVPRWVHALAPFILYHPWMQRNACIHGSSAKECRLSLILFTCKFVFSRFVLLVMLLAWCSLLAVCSLSYNGIRSPLPLGRTLGRVAYPLYFKSMPLEGCGRLYTSFSFMFVTEEADRQTPDVLRSDAWNKNLALQNTKEKNLMVYQVGFEKLCSQKINGLNCFLPNVHGRIWKVLVYMRYILESVGEVIDHVNQSSYRKCMVNVWSFGFCWVSPCDEAVTAALMASRNMYRRHDFKAMMRKTKVHTSPGLMLLPLGLGMKKHVMYSSRPCTK